ncbi:MAG: FlgD immunoglobulin-like domain containing protein, partial [bacterium]
LERPAQIRLEVLNTLGQSIRTLYDGNLSSGQHLFNWDGTSEPGAQAASGKYLIRLLSESDALTKTITLLR